MIFFRIERNKNNKLKKNLSDPVIKFFVSVLGLFFIFFVMKELKHIFVPFVIAYLLFIFFEPLNSYLIKKKIPSAAVIAIDILITVSILYGVSRGLIDSALQFSAQLPQFEIKLNKIISETARSFGFSDYHLTNFNIKRALKNFDYSIFVGDLFSSTLSVLTTTFLILFFFIFISSGHDKIVAAVRARFVEKEIKFSLKKLKKGKKNISGLSEVPSEESIQRMTIQREVKLKKTVSDITEQVQKYVITKFLISLSMGVIMGVVLGLFGVEFFIIWAALAVVLNFIPNIGSVVSITFPVLMALIQFGSFSYALIIAAIIIVIQNVIGNIIEPKIMGDRLGLNPIVILLSLLLWGYLWGIVGMFLSVPLTAIIKIIISNSSSRNMRFITNLMSN